MAKIKITKRTVEALKVASKDYIALSAFLLPAFGRAALRPWACNADGPAFWLAMPAVLEPCGPASPRSISSVTVCSRRAARAGLVRIAPSWPDSISAESPWMDAQIATAISKAPSRPPPISAMTSSKYLKGCCTL